MATVEIEGLRDLDIALTELPKSVAKATLRRVLKKAAQPMLDAAREKAPQLTGELKEQIIAGTKLTKRQAKFAKQEGRSSSEIHIGTSNPAGIPQEFGTFKEGSQPFMRPAWAETQDPTLAIVTDNLAIEIEKSRKRLAAKAARLAARG